MINATLWNQLLVWPIVNLLIAFYKLFEWLKIPGALGFAIILLTLVMRLLLYPLMTAQLKSARKMAKLKPHLDDLSKKHKDNKTALQQAQLELYKEHGVNPAAGCLPLLIQFPVLIALYGVFNSIFSAGDINSFIESVNTIVYSPILKLTTLDLTFFGMNLNTKPSEWQTQGLWLLTIPIITAGLQWYQTKLMMPQETPKPATAVTKSPKNKNEEEKPKEDMAMEMQKQMAIITPLMFGFFAFQFPIGLALYWNVFGIFGIIHQRMINAQS